MNVLIVLGCVLLALLIAVIIFVRVTRKPGEEHPKRRELKRANLAALTARMAMNDVEEIFGRYHAFIVNDVVAAPMADEITNRIRRYKSETLELDK